MERNLILVIGMVLLSLSAFAQNGREPKACFGTQCFDLEVAQQPRDRAKGLMFREKLDPDVAMLFVFEQEAIHSSNTSSSNSIRQPYG